MDATSKTYDKIKFTPDPIPEAKPSTAKPASKHFDIVMGVDIHFVRIPPSPAPIPMPHPHVGIVFDLIEMLPPILMPKALMKPMAAVMGAIAPLTQNMFGPGQQKPVHQVQRNEDAGPVDPDAGPWAPQPTIGIGANVFVNGMRRTQVSTESKVIPFHIPMGAGFFFPKLVKHKGQAFMGSKTVVVEGMPFAYMGLPFLSCQCIGMPSPNGNSKKDKKPGFFLPTAIVLPIPFGKPVNVGGPPIPYISPLTAFRAFRKFSKTQTFKKLVKKLADFLQKNGKTWLHKLLCTLTGHPVDVASGNFLTDKVDIELPGPIPLKWERSYYSCSPYQGPMGKGWHHSYDVFLTPIENEPALILNTSDGRDVLMPKLKIDELHYDRSEKIIFFRDQDGYGYRNNEHQYYRFSNVEIEGRYTLDRIETKSGHKIKFRYNNKAVLTGITDSGGRELIVENDSYGQIVAIHVPHPKQIGERIYLVRYEYDSHKRLVKATDPLGRFMSFEYDGSYMVSETDRNGLSFYFEYDEFGRCYHTWGDGGIYNHHLEFFEGYTVVTNSLGYQTTYEFNESGLVENIINPNGGVIEMEYNEYAELLMETDPEGLTTSYNYDIFGNKTSILKPSGALSAVKYQQNLPIEMKDPMGNVAKVKYNDCGNIIQFETEKSSTKYQYEDGLLKQVVEGDSVSTLFYDQYKNLTEIIGPDGKRATMEYDSLGRCVRTTDAQRNAFINVFDKNGRLLQTTVNDNKRKFEYDGEGNLIRSRDKHNDVAFEYSGIGRLISQSDNFSKVSFEYNTEEELTKYTNDVASEYQFILNENNEIVEEIGFDGRRKIYERDLAGNVTKRICSDGTSVNYLYDGSGNLSILDYSDGKQEYFIRRSDGLLIEAGNENGIVQFFRDQSGRVIKERCNGFEVDSEYNDAGERVGFTSNLGGKIDFKRDGFGRILEVKAGLQNEWQSKISRDGRGAEIERQLPGGLRSRWRRDRFGRPIQHDILNQFESIRERHLTWSAGKLKEVNNPVVGAKQFDYLENGSLSYASYPEGDLIFKKPDLNGNVYEEENQSDRTYGKEGEVLTSKDRRFEYDDNGFLIRKVEADGRIWDYNWNSSGMLQSVNRPDGEQVLFTYDPLGRRLSKSFKGQTTYWAWDGDKPIHEWQQDSETPNAGVDENGELLIIQPENLTQWVFEDDLTPVAKLTTNRQYSIVSDYLGTPVTMFDENGENVWDCELDIYGNIRQEQGEIECPFRFQGQYFDAETGLHYNRFRYYDPSTGLFISKDPIGLSGNNPNNYAYSFDSNIAIDPFGLACKLTKVDGVMVYRKDIDLFKRNSDDKYGHWWIEMDNKESYGWWPKEGVDYKGTLFGVDGELNGQTRFGGTLTLDPHMGDRSLGVNAFQVFSRTGESKAQILTKIRDFANNYSGSWSWPFGQNCHSFQKALLRETGLVIKPVP